MQKSGSWYSYEEERLGQGRENAKQFLKENKDIMLMIQEQIREHYGLDNHGVVRQTEEAQEELEFEE